MADEKIQLCNYAVAFIDLLGQKEEMLDRHLPDNPEEALKLVKRSVGRIIGTQNNFQKFFDGFTKGESVYSLLPPNTKERVPDMAPGQLNWQRFSDGFVIYVPLGDGLVKSPINSIFGMLLAAGAHCTIGLAASSPLRVGIDVAWGVEYRPGELYGAALGYAYQLESQVAKWPRVVVGDGLVEYLQHNVMNPASNPSLQHRKIMSEICLSLIKPDTDNQNIIHYLGKEFRRCSKGVLNNDLWTKAQRFIEDQLQHWQAVGNNKLSERYLELLSYYTRSRDEA